MFSGASYFTIWAMTNWMLRGGGATRTCFIFKKPHRLHCKELHFTLLSFIAKSLTTNFLAMQTLLLTLFRHIRECRVQAALEWMLIPWSFVHVGPQRCCYLYTGCTFFAFKFSSFVKWAEIERCKPVTIKTSPTNKRNYLRWDLHKKHSRFYCREPCTHWHW